MGAGGGWGRRGVKERGRVGGRRGISMNGDNGVSQGE